MAKKKTTGTRPGDRHKDRKMVSLPSNYYAGLKQLADRSGRPITWELRSLIRKALEAAGLPLSDET